MTEHERSQIERINQVSAMARTSWITLLAYLAFVGVTLLAVEDADFFVPSRQTQLPLVDVSIPTASFFFFAPILAAALYVYLHIVLLKLWDAIADVSYEYGASIDGHPFGDHLNPWLVNDWALSQKGGPFTPARPLRTVGNWASILLVWVAAPFVLFFFWLWSMPAHDPLLTLLLGLCFLVALHAGVTSWRAARAWLGQPSRRDLQDGRWRHRDIWYLGVLLACISIVRVSFPLEFGTFSTLATIDLSGAEMVDLPEAWRTPETARRAYRETWCKREGLAMEICNHLSEPERPVPVSAEVDRAKWCEEHKIAGSDNCADRFIEIDLAFQKDWDEERKSSIANLPKLNLADRDLRRAFAPGVSFVGADLRRVRLNGAVLIGARMEQASLGEARLDGANLELARLDRADLSNASLTSVSLLRASLKDANLEKAHLEDANLGGAQLQGARLVQARLDRTQLWEAKLGRANLGEAEGEEAYLWEADLRSADLRWARLLRANLGEAQLDSADLRNALLSDSYLQGASLKGANLEEAQLAGANLNDVNLDGSNLVLADLKSVNWDGATIGASTAQWADFRGGKNLVQAQLDTVIGDGDTLLPEVAESGASPPYYVWSCWPAPPEGFEGLVSRLASWSGKTPGEIRAQLLCEERDIPTKIGLPCPIDLPPEECGIPRSLD